MEAKKTVTSMKSSAYDRSRDIGKSKDIAQRLELTTARHRPRQPLTRNVYCSFGGYINGITVPGAANGRRHWAMPGQAS